MTRASIDDQWKVLGSLTELIRFADAKAGALLATNGVLAAAVTGTLRDNRPLTLGHAWIFVPAAAGLAGLIVSAFFCLDCIRPRIGARAHHSLLYFRHIAAFPEPSAYEKAAAAASDEASAFREVTVGVWANARIARAKYRCIAAATWSFIAGLGFLVLALMAGVALS